MSKAHLLELSKEGLWRRAAVQSATHVTPWTRDAPAKVPERPRNVVPIFEGKAAIVPRPEPPWLVEPEEQPVMMVPVTEVTMLEMRHMIEPEHEIAIAELEHQPPLPEVPEVPRLKVWGMSEPECKTTVVEVPEVP